MFSCVLYDSELETLYVGHDPIGVRALYYGYLHNGALGFASEMKNL